MLHVDPSTIVAQADPILALIEAHRAAYAAWTPLAAVWNETIVGSAEWDAAEAAAAEPGAREWDALQALLKARPTTAAGLWALTAYLPEAVRKVSPDSKTFEQEALDALREGAVSLGLATVQVEARAVSADHVDPMLAAIERHRLAHHAFGEAVTASDVVAIEQCGGDVSPEALAILEARRDEAAAADDQAWREIFAARPTTIGGYVALLRYLDRHWQGFEGMNDEPDVLGALVKMVQGLTLPAAGAAPSTSHADPHVGLLPALRRAFAWTRDANPIDDRGPVSSPEWLAARAVLDHCWDLADSILALPTPKTLPGLGALALALSVWAEGSVGRDPETYKEERRVASVVRAMMAVSGVEPLTKWCGFGDEPDSDARWEAMRARVGEGSLPAWALAGRSSPDAEEVATAGQVPPAAAPASDLTRACIGLVERRAWLDQGDNARTIGEGDDAWTVELDRHNAVFRRAINEPSASVSDLAAKARLMLDDFDRFHPEEKTTTDDERLMRVILREVIAQGGRAAPELPLLHPAAAWAGLPPETRDALGAALVDLVFQDFLSGAAYADEDWVLTDEDARGAASARSDALLNRIYDNVAAALPALFGPEGEHPAWVEDYRAGRLTISAGGVVS